MQGPSALFQRSGKAQGGLFDELLDKNKHRPSPTRGKTPSPIREARFCVLASSSGGNCSVIQHGSGQNYRLTLIDCGLTIKKTKQLMANVGLDFARIDDVLLTHLDNDHCNRAWARSLPRHARFRVLNTHTRRARNAGIAAHRMTMFSAGDADPFLIAGGVKVTPTILAHDDHGVAAFRIDWPGVSLGFATDLGRVTNELVHAMQGVDVMAIESNYCPKMQKASSRPDYLKQRIMGGAGHLSNEEAAEFVHEIQPKRETVLLHLSRQCNTPQRALEVHKYHCRPTRAASHDTPTPWIEIYAPEEEPVLFADHKTEPGAHWAGG